MNKKWLVISLIPALIIIILAACSQSTPTPTVDQIQVDQTQVDQTQVDQTQIDQTQVDQTQVDQTQVDQAQALIEEKCSVCHSANIVFQSNYDEAGWSRVFDVMIQRGAQVSDQEKTIMIDWLLSQ
jgi:hypothetical protein